MPRRPVLDGDNGATLKAATVLATLHWLGIMPSYSRLRVSNDNGFVEALSRSIARPCHPKGSVISVPRGNRANRFVHGYNHEHPHCAICYVTAAQRHAGARSCAVGGAARDLSASPCNPRCWSGKTATGDQSFR